LAWPALLLVICFCFPPARAVEPDEVLTDPALELRARQLSRELRCLVCQNQSIDDSHAELARDLRVLVRERLRAGDRDEDVRAFLVARYGDFVLLRPPFSANTLLLWLAPLLLAAAAALIIVRGLRRLPVPADAATSAADLPPLSEAEAKRLDRLLAENNGDGPR
jgi:cytochrome c-type biogenesis protein CcmH